MPEEEAEMDVEEGEDVVGEEEAEELVEEGEAEELGGEEEGDEGEYDYFDDIMDDREEAMKQHRKRAQQYEVKVTTIPLPVQSLQSQCIQKLLQIVLNPELAQIYSSGKNSLARLPTDLIHKLLKCLKHQQYKDATLASTALLTPNIEKLWTGHINNKTAYQISVHCNRLSKLSLEGATGLIDHSIKRITEANPNLTHLNLSGCIKLTQTSMKYIAQNLLKLQTLNISKNNKCNDEWLSALTSSDQFTSLTKLDISGNWRNVSLDGICKFISSKRHKDLRVLNVGKRQKQHYPVILECLAQHYPSTIQHIGMTYGTAHIPILSRFTNLSKLKIAIPKEHEASAEVEAFLRSLRLSSLDLTTPPWGKQKPDYFIAIIATQTNLKSLKISMGAVTPQLIDVLKVNPNLKRLSVSTREKPMPAELVKYILTNCSVKSLELRYINDQKSGFYDNTVLSIKQPWCNGQLRELLLTDMGLSNKGVKALVEHAQGLRKLRIRRCYHLFTKTSLQLLSQLPELVELDLGGYKLIEDDGLKMFEKGFPKLRSLDIVGWSSISKEAWDNLKEFLNKRNVKLVTPYNHNWRMWKGAYQPASSIKRGMY